MPVITLNPWDIEVAATATIEEAAHVDEASPETTPEETAPVPVKEDVKLAVPFPKNRKRCLVFLVHVMAFVGLAVGLGVGLSNKSSSRKPLTSSTNQTSAGMIGYQP